MIRRRKMSQMNSDMDEAYLDEEEMLPDGIPEWWTTFEWMYFQNQCRAWAAEAKSVKTVDELESYVRAKVRYYYGERQGVTDSELQSLYQEMRAVIHIAE